MTTTEDIRELVGPALNSAGLELWDVELSRDVLRVMIDRPGGIDLDALSLASGVLSPILDEHPEATPAGRYQLEVSSPGAERTLRTPAQYHRYVGAEITVKTTGPVDGSRRHRGRLLKVGEETISVEPEDAAGTALELRYDQIERSRTVLVWGPAAPKPGGQKSKGHKAATRHAARPAAASSAPSAIEPKDAGS